MLVDHLPLLDRNNSSFVAEAYLNQRQQPIHEERTSFLETATENNITVYEDAKVADIMDEFMLCII